MLFDRQNNPLPNATTDAARSFDQAVEAFALFRGDPIAPLDAALAAAPDFALATIAKSFMYALTSEPLAMGAARQMTAGLAAKRLSPRESALLRALTEVIDGDWTRAALTLDHYSMSAPHDFFALHCGHLIDFYRGNARSLRDRLARVLPKWSLDIPGYPLLLGMYAFGLEESGELGRAEDAGRAAIALEPYDSWAHHAVTHVLEMQGKPEAGLGWCITREPFWAGEDNQFKIHNWWHRAIFHLELGQTTEALSLYDGPIRGAKSPAALNLVDASALLWRLMASGVDVHDRWSEVALAWDAHADGQTYPFNDWHAVMAYLGAGRDGEVERVRSTLARASGNGETTAWGHNPTLALIPLIDGFTAFHRRDYDRCIEALHGARYMANRFGGSHAQRDVIDWTLVEAAIRSGRRDVAKALANERLASKPVSPLARSFAQRAGEAVSSR